MRLSTSDFVRTKDCRTQDEDTEDSQDAEDRRQKTKDIQDITHQWIVSSMSLVFCLRSSASCESSVSSSCVLQSFVFVVLIVLCSVACFKHLFHFFLTFNSMTQQFIPKNGGFRKLFSYQKAEIIYDATLYFTQRFFRKGDRTIDQMVQAARSGKTKHC
jgi:hypothetical protein